jgi:hypothetical protein
MPTSTVVFLSYRPRALKQSSRDRSYCLVGQAIRRASAGWQLDRLVGPCPSPEPPATACYVTRQSGFNLTRSEQLPRPPRLPNIVSSYTISVPFGSSAPLFVPYSLLQRPVRWWTNPSYPYICRLCAMERCTGRENSYAAPSPGTLTRDREDRHASTMPTGKARAVPM